jgi:hypothetical protein
MRRTLIRRFFIFPVLLYRNENKSVSKNIPLEMFKLILTLLLLYSCCSHLNHRASVKLSFHFSFLILVGRILERGSARRKAAT